MSLVPPLSSRPRSRWTAGLVVALAVTVAACGGGDDATGDEGATPTPSTAARSTPSTAPPDATDGPAPGTDVEEGAEEANAVACTDVEATVLKPVRAPDEEEGWAAFDEEAFEAAFRRLAEDGPPELADAVAVVQAAMAADEEADPSDEEVLTLKRAFDRLIVWGAENCGVEGPIWACFVRMSFVPVGHAIPPSEETDALAGRAATPEDAVGDGEDGGERVEVSRTDDEVVFAWLDERGLAIYSEVAERGPDGWAAGRSSECQDEEELLAPDRPPFAGG